MVSADGRSWNARRNSNLQDVLGDWADRAGWTLVYDSKLTYNLQAGAEFEGDFVQAGSSLVRSIKASPQPFITFYTRNKTAVVTNNADQVN